MEETMLKCPNCGANMKNSASQILTCTHCGTTFLLSEILGDEANSEALQNDEEIYKKLKYNEVEKKAETFMFQGNYEQAEQQFKLLISIDDKNYIGYLGVVKAKTKNYNVLPADDSHKYYAKEALRVASDDDKHFVKSELEKVDILKTLIENKTKPLSTATAKNENEKVRKFLTKLAYFVTGIVAVAVLVGVVISLVIKNNDENLAVTQLEISTSEEFMNFVTNSDKYLSSTIIIKQDIDLGGQTISPIATKSDKWFTGTFTGNGYTIKNFSVTLDNYSEFSYVGLFAKTSGATISGLILEDVSVSVANSSSAVSSICVGLISGYSKDTTIINSAGKQSCEIEISCSENGIFAGGLVGRAENTSIKLCYFSGDVVLSSASSGTDNFTGGIAGYIEKVSIENTYFSGNISATYSSGTNSNITHYVGGIVGLANYLSENSKLVQSFVYGNIETTSLNENITVLANAVANTVNVSSEITILNYVYGNCVYDEDTLENDYAEIVSTEEDLTTWIENKFSSLYWNDTDTTAPTLVIEKST